jgi:DNA-binding XRE family transcriptional regulator
MDCHDRVKQARIAAGYLTATEAARAMGVKAPSYIHHENGRAGLSRAGQRYARFFRVDYEWLMTGRGEMRARTASEAGVPVDGFVRDGAVIDPGGAARQESSEIILPAESALGAFVVAGDSQRPRFLDGEIILYDRRPVSPDTLVDRIAIVQIAAGRKMIKIIRRADAARWRLEWHNAPAEEAVELLAAWRYVGSLAGR